MADGRSGYLVAERDVGALAARLGYLVDHPGIWPEMGLAGRKIVEREYDRDVLKEKLLGIYRQLMETRC